MKKFISEDLRSRVIWRSMAVCHGARQPSVLELRRRARFAGFANGERPDRHGRSPSAATCGHGGLTPIAMLFSVRSRSRWTSRWLNWPRCCDQSMEPYLHRAPWRFLDRHSMTVKKTAHAREQERSDVLARRRAWFKAQPDLNSEQLVFIDETGASTKMARLRGRARRGMRCQSPIPHGHWKTTTFAGAVRLTGMTAPMVLDGPMTGEWFGAYAQQVLAPTLRPGDIVILDNLPAHKTAAAREAIEAVGTRMLFIPPNSPDFNPIENAFSKLKAILPKAAAQTIPELWDAIRDALPRFTPEECANYFTATGYEPE
jgi:transposase